MNRLVLDPKRAVTGDLTWSMMRIVCNCVWVGNFWVTGVLRSTFEISVLSPAILLRDTHIISIR